LAETTEDAHQWSVAYTEISPDPLCSRIGDGLMGGGVDSVIYDRRWNPASALDE